MQLDVRALTSTISLAVAQAVKDAMAAHQATVSSTVTPTPSAAVEQVVQNEVLSYTTGTTKQALLPALLGVGDQPRPSHPFSSIAVNLGSRVSAKIKAKIWANEYTDFGALLSIAPSRKVCSFHGFQWGCCKSTTVNSRALHTPKKVTNISQWLTAFNTFVSIYSVKCSQDAPKLMKYCEVVRDLANKSGDWIFYDEQFRYLRQSSPEFYPWDQIHWELWLRAMTNFRVKSQSFTGSDRTTPRGRFRTSTPPFPRGTCWSFHSGRHCRGGQYEHVCFKCGAKHPATQYQNQNSQLRTNPIKSGASISAQPLGQFPSNSRKSGPVCTAPCGLRPNPKTIFNQWFPFRFSN